MNNNREIKLGAICLFDWTPQENKMFSYDFYYEEEEYSDEVKKCNSSEIVLPPEQVYTLIIDYPLSTPYMVKIRTEKTGLTRIKLADLICKHYRKIYSTKENKKKYGIWGHDIGDLILIDATVKDNTILLGVDS